MTVLPIVARELRVAARSRMFYLGRFLTALGAVGLGSYLMLVFNAAGFVGRVQGGRVVFTSLAWVGLLYCIGLARNTVDCVSEEKREGTLGLLFLTDLKGYDVALGKLCANSVKSFYGLLAAVPVVCCAWVMGGVGAGELWRTVLALLNIFFFSQAAGLFVSTFSRDARRATGGATVLLL
ncbi:MAG TPA: ABC transporter permease subunit, partial [Candidatus Acidoferrum sp.]|nr:ABC transporter permease subunit [Candidatus Acidoferrum sp.]